MTITSTAGSLVPHEQCECPTKVELASCCWDCSVEIVTSWSRPSTKKPVELLLFFYFLSKSTFSLLQATSNTGLPTIQPKELCGKTTTRQPIHKWFQETFGLNLVHARHPGCIANPNNPHIASPFRSRIPIPPFAPFLYLRSISKLAKPTRLSMIFPLVSSPESVTRAICNLSQALAHEDSLKAR